MRRMVKEQLLKFDGADVITVTHNEILYSLNKPDDFILAIVEFDGDGHRVHYIRRPFQREPDFGVTSVDYSFMELLARGEEPKRREGFPEESTMYFFYVDESGNLDPAIEGVKGDGTKFTKDHVYVLTAVSLYESLWRGFETTLNGMKFNLAKCSKDLLGRHLAMDECEVKSNWIKIPKERAEHPFLANLPEDKLQELTDLYYRQLERNRMAVFSVVIDKRHLLAYIDAEKLHRKAWELLLERVQGYLRQEHPKHHGILITDDVSPQTNRNLALKHAYILRKGTTSKLRLDQIIEMPLFVRSGLSNGVQLADLVSYNIYRAFREEDLDYPYFRRILPSIWSSRLSPGDKLDGLKVFPNESPLIALAVEAGKKLARDQAAPSFES